MLDATDSPAAALKTAQAHMYQGRFEAALEALAPLLEAEPEHAEALYMRAACLRYLGRREEAFDALAALKAAAPEFGRAYQEEGHLHRALGREQEALAAYRRACRFNPALHASWMAQAEILEAQGRGEEARQARAQGERILALPKELVSVTHLLHEDRILKAEKLCRAFLQKHPHHVEAMRLLAGIAKRFGVMEDAEFLLESAIGFEPDNVQLRLDYIEVLRKRQKFAKALEEARLLHEREPDNPLFASHHAIELMQTGDYPAAISLFDAVLKRVPDDPATLTSRAHALKTAGRQEEAVASYRRAAEVKPDHGDAWYGLANLKTYRFTRDEIAAMERQEARPDLAFADRIHLCFALGKAHEDHEQYERSFEYYARGNALKRRQTRYTSAQMEEEFEAQKRVCTRELFESKGETGHPAPDPIFIVGLPRAGSTLIEQILASHSQIDGTLELPNILALSHRLRGRKRVGGQTRYPAILAELSGEKLRELGADYIEGTALHRRGAPFFTDKMPNNFRHIGLIKLILPNAKIIDARRHPMACCFSGFKQLFAEGQEFTYGLEEIGRYYRGYVDLMAHWDEVLPGAVLRVHHEDVVDDLEGQVRRMLDYLGLPFEPACVEFHKTRREVRTASSEQVRQPIFRSGTEQWRHFEPWLDELKTALGPALTGYRD